MEHTESQLIAAAQEGDESAKTELYNRYVRLLTGYLYRSLGSSRDAEDIAQEAFLRAFHKIDSFQGKASFKNWLFQIAKNIVADHWKTHYKENTTYVDDFYGFSDSPSYEIDTDEQAEAHQTAVNEQLRVVLQSLSDEYREVLEYRFLKGYSIKETAEALGISESNAKVRQYRALKKAAQLNAANLWTLHTNHN